MMALRAVGVIVLFLGVSSASGDPDASPTCPYCLCVYNGPDINSLYRLKKERFTKDIQCYDWCKKHYPVWYWDYGPCYWDEPSSTCETHCPHCSGPGGCYQTNSSKCLHYDTKESCHGSYGGNLGCSCGLKAGIDACFPCYQCQCSYAMGKITVNASDTHRVKATPEICAKRCQEYGKGFGQSSWGKCGDGNEPLPGPAVSPIAMEGEDHLPESPQCNSWGCHWECKELGNTCHTTVNHKCNGTTECSCPLLGSEVHPDCPTRDLPPVSPSPATPPPSRSPDRIRAASIEIEEDEYVGRSEVLIEEGDYDGYGDTKPVADDYQQHYCPAHTPGGPAGY